MLPTEDDVWRTGECCRLLTAMAALWHDVGKIGKAFQTKLVRGTPTSDAFRHEWLSLRLFQAFVGTDKEDRFWLERLAGMDTNKAALSRMAKGWLKALYRDTDDGMSGNGRKTSSYGATLAELPPLARVIGWLLLGHHRLPAKAGSAVTADSIIRNPLKSIVPGWGYVHDFDRKSLKETWTIRERDLPCFSQVWREHVSRTARHMLDRPDILATDWLANTYAIHVSRLGLMLADHIYSALGDPQGRVCGDPSYEPYANTNRQTRKLHQRLDEHLIGVERLSSLLLRRLGCLRETLPVVGTVSSSRFRRRSLASHLHKGDVLPVPERVQGYRTVSRKQFKSNPERLRRRLVRRHHLSPEEAELRIPDHLAHMTDLPFLQVKSASTGQHFRLFVEHGQLQEQSCSGGFSLYGLSATTTIPWF